MVCKLNVTDGQEKCYRDTVLTYLNHAAVGLYVPLQLCGAGKASVVSADFDWGLLAAARIRLGASTHDGGT